MSDPEVKENCESLSIEAEHTAASWREEERSVSGTSHLNDSETEDNASILSTTTTTTTSRSKSPAARRSKTRRHSKSLNVVKAMFKYK